LGRRLLGITSAIFEYSFNASYLDSAKRAETAGHHATAFGLVSTRREIAEWSIYIIVVSGGDNIPRQGGPGTGRSDLLIVSKMDLAPYDGASFEVMANDAALHRGGLPTLFSSLRNEIGLDAVVEWVEGCRNLSCTRPRTPDQSGGTSGVGRAGAARSTFPTALITGPAWQIPGCGSAQYRRK